MALKSAQRKILSLPDFETQFSRGLAVYLVIVPTELSLVILTLFKTTQQQRYWRK